MRNFALLAVFTLACAFGAQAQKFGYVNSNLILSELPEVKAADSDLTGFRDQQQKLLQTKIEAFQAELAELERKNAAGELTPKQIQEEQTRMQTKQQELAQMEQEVGQQLQQRREQKFQPIYDKVNTAIAEVAKAGEFTYVFDSATGGVILYADETMDLTAQVREKLSTMPAAPTTPAAAPAAPAADEEIPADAGDGE